MDKLSEIRRDSYLVVLSYLADEVAECLVNVDALLSRCLDELASKVLCKVTTLCLSLGHSTFNNQS